MDRMRESLFSILGPLSGAAFLDLFSGSGCVGIEAASRGASPVTLVESDRRKKRIILENISFVHEDIRLKLLPAERFIRLTEGPYDYIYADPPFPMEKKGRLIHLVEEKRILPEGGLFIIHYPDNETLPDSVGALVLKDQRKYGRSMLRFYQQT